MANKFKRMLATVMVLVMIVSVLPVQSLAAETETYTELSPEGLTTEVNTTTDTTTDADGNTVITVTIEKDTEGTLKDGSELERHQTTTETETYDENGNLVGASGVNEGKETTTEIIDTTKVDVNVQVPGEVGESNSAEFGESSSKTTGDEKEGEDDPEYNQTTTTVKPGSVTITTTDKTYEQEFSDETQLEYTNADVTPDGTNDLHYVGATPEEFLPGYEGETVIPDMIDGYDYTYVGSGNTSILTPAVVGTRPLTDKEKVEIFGEHYQAGAYINAKFYPNLFLKYIDPEYRDTIAKNPDGSYVTDADGFLLDVNGNKVFKGERTATGPNGETIYLRRFDNYDDSLKVEGWYEDGEWVKDLNGQDSYYAGWAGPQQFLLVDSNGKIITTYCADQTTPTEKGFGYNIENLEDATYYTEEEAARIRAIAKNGYWGISSEAGQADPAEGSLEYMRQQLLAAGFTAEELASLNDGVALTATQMAIWSCSNKMHGIQFVNAHYDLAGPKGDGWGPNYYDSKDKEGCNYGKVPTDKEDEIELMFRIYTYLVELEGEQTKGTMADTIITAENAIADMNVTVIEKAKDHGNNKDDIKDNDAFVTDLSFALVVEPTGDKDESLKVTLVTSDGQKIVGRICGEMESDDEILLEKEGDNYWFRNIVLTEGGQTFTLNLEGVQNLDQGVYLYSSEVRDTTTSQTLVGKAGGKRDFDVTVSLSFEMDVEEGVIVKERVWRDEYDPTEEPENPPEPPQLFRLDVDDTEELPDEEVPLAAPVTTGDTSFPWFLVVMMAVCGIVVINLFGKKGKYEEI